MKWSETKYQAALLVAQDRLSNAEIASKCGITSRGLDKWKAEPEFAIEVRRHLDAWRERVMERGIASKDRRMYRLDDRWRRGQALMAERAAHPDIQKMVGGKTGLIGHKRKVTRSNDGKAAIIVDEFEVDTGLLKELRELEAQAAHELGQWEKDRRAPNAPVILVVSQGQTTVAAASPRLSASLPQAPVAQLPGVVIDLVPERQS